MKTKYAASSASLLLSALALGGGALFYFAAAALAGGVLAPLRLLVFLLAFTVCLLGSGLWCLRVLAPEIRGADSLVLAFLPGCGCVFAGYAAIWYLGALAPFLRLSPLWFLLPAWVLGAREWALRLSDAEVRARLLRPHAGAAVLILALTAGAVLAVSAVWNVLPSAGADRLRAWTYLQDQLWSVGNAAAVRFGLPLQDMRAAGLLLHYHFLNDVTAGLLALGTGASAWAGFCWFWNLPVQLLGILGLFCAGRKLAPRAGAAAALVPAAVYFCSPNISTLPTNLFTNANGQATAMLALAAGILLIENLPRALTRRSALRWLALCVFCAAVLCMLKSTIGVLLILALGAALAVGLLTRQASRAGLLTLAGFGLGFGAVYALVLRLANNNLLFTAWANLAQLKEAYPHYFSPALLALYAAGLVYSAVRFRHLSLSVLALNAFAIGGMMAYVLYHHYSFSQVYFALAAVPAALLTALPFVQAAAGWFAARSAEGAAAQPAARAKRRAGRLCAGVLALALCLACASELAAGEDMLRRGAQAALRCIGRPAFTPEETRMTNGDWAAARWLAQNTPAETIFATNRNNKQFTAAEGTFHFYTAASERRCYLESYRYALDYDRSYHEIRRRLEQVSDAIFYRLSEADAFALARSEGIDYLVVSELVPNAPQWSADPVYENAEVRIYAVGA